MLIDGRNTDFEFTDCSFETHSCGCGWPNASPPCAHCEDCWLCSPVCIYCDDEHGDPEMNGDQCPQLAIDLAMVKLLGYN